MVIKYKMNGDIIVHIIEDQKTTSKANIVYQWMSALRTLGVRTERSTIISLKRDKITPDIIILESVNINANDEVEEYLRKLVNAGVGIVLLGCSNLYAKKESNFSFFQEFFKDGTSFASLTTSQFHVQVLKDSILTEPFCRGDLLIIGADKPNKSNIVKAYPCIIASNKVSAVYIRQPLGEISYKEPALRETCYQLMRNSIKYLLLSRNLPVAEIWRWPDAAKCACVITADIHVKPIRFYKRILMSLYILYQSIKHLNVKNNYFWDLLIKDPFGDECLSARKFIDMLTSFSIGATIFFDGACTKNGSECIETIKNAIIDSNFSVGGHSSASIFYVREGLSFRQQLEDIKNTEKLISDATGRSPDKVWRCHGCQYNNDTIKALKQLNYIAVSNDILSALYPNLKPMTGFLLINAPWNKGDHDNLLYEVAINTPMDSRDCYLRGQSFVQFLHEIFVPAFEEQYRLGGMFTPLLHPGLIENGWKDIGFKKLKGVIKELKRDFVWFTNMREISNWYYHKEGVNIDIRYDQNTAYIQLHSKSNLSGFTLKVTHTSPIDSDSIDSSVDITIARYSKTPGVFTQYIVIKDLRCDSVISIHIPR